ncbi:MAG: ATP-binding protein [Paludibacteraceae bacterium]|nr:ATP-binding protein [Paludibacteraceae bacterium]
MEQNAKQLELEIEWFNKILETRIELYFNQGSNYQDIKEIIPPELTDCFYSQTLQQFNLSFEERVILILSLIPHIRPELLDTFFTQNKNFERPFTEFGGWKGITHGGFLPTGETAAFILAGNDLSRRFDIIKLFEADHYFHKANIVQIEDNGENEPFLSGKLSISTEYLYKCTIGETHKPDYNIHFPAKLIETKLNWNDLILAPEVFDEVNQILTWIKYESTLMNDWNMKKYIKPGYRCLFYGPPGTGKTLTAGLIGESTGFDVYRIDLSMLVSKYIGETEKNLSNVFDQAENKKWILFFDEADSLFGKRTQTSSSNDRYANQETSYLLQRIEDFPGVVILATNLKNNMDEAFSRRFQSIIHFPIPDYEQRLKLWQNILPEYLPLESSIDLKKIALKYELTGGAIINVVRFCALKVLKNNAANIPPFLLSDGIKKEMEKEGKVFSNIYD